MAKKKAGLPKDTDVFRTTTKHNRHTEDGLEVLNPIPMQPPLGYKAAPSLSDTIRQQVIAAKRLAELEMVESEEEADDFEVDDDPIPHSPWENDLVPSIKETRARLRELEKQEKLYADAEAAQRRASEVPDPRQKPDASEPSA